MQRTKNIRGECAHCGEAFSFPAESIGLTATCPHCGKETVLMLATPEAEPALPRKTLVMGIVAIVILILGLLGSLIALNRAGNLAKERKPQTGNATNAAQPRQ
jgi:hypothetical protein